MNAPLSRRAFFKLGAALGAGLTLGFHLVSGRAAKAGLQSEGTFAPNAFLRIAPDETVTVIVKHLEMGQGVYTGLPALVAEELEVPWESIRVEAAPADHTLYNNLLWGPMQGTGGSTAMANSYQQLRRAGATARQMLLAAAAQVWQKDARSLRAENGHVLDPATGRRLSYGNLVGLAASLEVPETVELKPPQAFKVIGRGFKRPDTRAKTDGTAVFGLDVYRPGMLTAVVARPPVFGAKLLELDAAAARALPGVKGVFAIDSGVAVVAADTWSALRGRAALNLQWETPAQDHSSEAIQARYRELAKAPGMVARRQGDAEAGLASAARRLEAEYWVPYLAHAPMEPLNCVVHVHAGGCEIWTGDQFQTMDQRNAARVLGIAPEQVRIHTLYAGGSFGRRANAKSDYIVEAVQIARQMGVPVKTLWTREDDIRGGFYRPCYLHRVEAALDAEGLPVAWRHRIVGQSIVAGTPFAGGMIQGGVDQTSVEGASNLPYAIPNLQVELHSPELPVPVLWWRSVGSTHTAFVTEAFIDELAAAAGADPYAFRRRLLKDHPRHLAVLDLAAQRAGWAGARPQPGWGRGIAVHESFGTYVAQVADVRVDKDGRFKVERVVCAVDCGLAVTPDVVRAQMEGGIGFGLSAALYGEITLAGGAARQSNFHDYRLLRIGEMPRVEVHSLPSEAPPSGVGEPGVPPIAPAVVNALYAATGKRIRSLPIGDRLAL